MFSRISTGRWSCFLFASGGPTVGRAGCSSIAGDNSRFDELHSRLAGVNSRLGLLREFPRTALIWLEFLGIKRNFFGEKRKIPGSTGIIGNSAAAERGWLTPPERVIMLRPRSLP
jgi:hypothetical protein